MREWRKVMQEKNIYGDRKSDRAGYRAKLNAAAEGDIFNLAENGTYIGTESERGKNNSFHAGVTEWDYFVKTAEIDGADYAVMANVRLKPDGEYVYSLQLNQKISRTAKQSMPTIAKMAKWILFIQCRLLMTSVYPKPMQMAILPVKM